MLNEAWRTRYRRYGPTGHKKAYKPYPTGTNRQHTISKRTRAILTAVAEGQKQASVARAFGVSRQCVNNMVQYWKGRSL